MKRFIIILIIALILGAVGVFLHHQGEVASNTQKEPSPVPSGFHEDYVIHSSPLPDTMDFAGEPVPMDYFDIREAIDRELQVLTYWQSHSVLNIKMAARFFPIIEPILADYDVPEDFKYLAVVESDLRHPRSPAGAVGMWQFLNNTGKEYGLEINREVDERYHPEKATIAACKYLKGAQDNLGTWTLAAASYNAGIRAIKRQQERQQEESFYNLLLAQETMRYISRILAVKYILNNPKHFGFHVDEPDKYLPIPTYKVPVDTAVDDFAEFAHKQGINYKVLKYFNPWLRQSYLRNRNGKTYYITLPKEGMRSWKAIKANYFAGQSQTATPGQ